MQDLLASVNQPAKRVAATLLGLALLLTGAVKVFGELQDALDRIWRVPAKGDSKAPGRSFGGFLLAALVFALIFKVMPRVHVM